ncbi:MAG: hypothetical protein LZF84_08190 [Nitrosomonas sp.]|nr:MAG: hypothetical protein LZF84_08190 [Nitrosomonas sp.]
MKHEAHGTQQPRPINLIGEGVSAAQRSDLLVQSINQRFLSNMMRFSAVFALHHRLPQRYFFDGLLESNPFPMESILHNIIVIFLIGVF